MNAQEGNLEHHGGVTAEAIKPAMLEKINAANAVVEKLQKAQAVFLTEYRGLSVAQMTELRVELRKSDAEMKVLKNRIVKKAIESISEKPETESFSGLNKDLIGPTAIVFSYGDVAQTAKTILEFKKSVDAIMVKAGQMEGTVLDSAKIKTISELPSREELLAKVVGSIQSPLRGLVMCCAGVQRNLVTVLAAIRDNKTS